MTTCVPLGLLQRTLGGTYVSVEPFHPVESMNLLHLCQKAELSGFPPAAHTTFTSCIIATRQCCSSNLNSSGSAARCGLGQFGFRYPASRTFTDEARGCRRPG